MVDSDFSKHGASRVRQTRWVLVAGTGLEVDMPAEDIRAAKAVGQALARHRLGLVAGSWHGVDYIVTESYLRALRSEDLDPAEYLIQVVAGDQKSKHAGGRLVKTPYGGREWLEPQKYADAVVLIGGRGGTFDAWLGALHSGMPRFPLGGTSGDSASAFKKSLDLWELIPVPGISREQFLGLGDPIRNQGEAEAIAEYLVSELLWPSLYAVDEESEQLAGDAPAVFISYSHKDLAWAQRLRTLLRPAERRGLISTWIDHKIEPSASWEDRINEALHTCSSAVLLVTGNFLSSEFIREKELPRLDARQKVGTVEVYWALLEPCNWITIPLLARVQSLNRDDIPVDACKSAADEQVRLIEIAERLTLGVTDHTRARGRESE